MSVCKVVDHDSLIGNVLEQVWLFPAAPVHPAWVDEFTTPFNTWEAFLKLADGRIVSVSPCEVQVHADRYPALGLALETCASDAMKMTCSGGEVVSAVPLDEIAGCLPSLIASVETSDPLGMDTTTQYTIAGMGWQIQFRHIFPPMTLGISVERPPIG